ncbi:tubulin-specific chaperone C [Episyrphus balteatus]|uniref:tubulin-specific chaperone C n=1 Tax=Episyrphus balteatus TaxID=286459 RepID=UPI00248573C7|nr:tubulin-specific chaperone C [Episyrphus balteatus]
MEVDNSLDVNAKKETVLERINKRNKDRQNYIDVKLELRNKENLDLEGIDYFSQTFGDRSKEIRANINNVSISKPEGAELLRVLSAITVEIQELQRYLSNSTIFLPDYKIKASQNVLNEISAHADEVRQKLMPKKKFGFNSKKVAPKVVVNPKVIAADKVDLSEKSSISSSAFTWTLANKSNEYLLLTPDQVDGQDITISNLSNCFVEIQGHAGSVQISGMENCTFLCGPIARSLFAENCKNSHVAAACQQLRLHSSFGCRLFLHVTCRAIIEDCTKIDVGSYNYTYPQIDCDFTKAALDKTINNYTDIADFNWLSPDVHSPNWQTIEVAVDWNEARKKFNENHKQSL